MSISRYSFLCLIICFSYGEANISINGKINKILSTDIMDIRNCPSYVDSCIYICSEGTSNPCHPEDLYSISIDTSESGESTEGSRYRIYFPWEYNGMNADKFVVTASWPCLSPTAVYASGDYAYWDIYGNDECPGTVQGSVWYGDDCEDDYGNIGSVNCEELIGRFCFVPGDTLNWSYNSDQSISTDVCDACWMSAPAWSYYDSLLYSDSLLSPGVCDVYDHCHHSASDNILCGVGYLDETDTSFVNIDYKDYVSEDYLITNYPNPFNSSTNILFSTKNDRIVSVVIYDVSGNHIRTLINEYKSAGQHSIDWNGKNEKGVSVSGGVYLYSIELVDFRKTKKMILVK